MVSAAKKKFQELCEKYPIKLFDTSEYKRKLPEDVFIRDAVICDIVNPIKNLINDEIYKFLNSSPFTVDEYHLFTVGMRISEKLERSHPYILYIYFDLQDGEYKPLFQDLGFKIEISEDNLKIIRTEITKKRKTLFTDEFADELLEKIKFLLLS